VVTANNSIYWNRLIPPLNAVSFDLKSTFTAPNIVVRIPLFTAPNIVVRIPIFGNVTLSKRDILPTKLLT